MRPKVDKGYVALSDMLPFSQQIDEHTVINKNGDLTCTIELKGIAFEATDNKVLDSYSDQWAGVLSQQILRSGNIALWTHIVRQEVKINPISDDYDNDFSREFAEQYKKKYGSDTQYINRLYLSPVMRISPSRLDRLGMRFIKENAKEIKERHVIAKEELKKTSAQICSLLKKYQPSLLGVNRETEESELASFYARLVNGNPVGIGLAPMNLSANICQNLVHFDNETISLMGPGHTKYAAVLTMKAPYEMGATYSTLLEGLLGAPFEFVLSQSAIPIAYDKADTALKDQENKVKSTTGNAILIEQIKRAREELQAGKITMLEHEFLLVIYADSIKALNKNINAALEITSQRKMPLERPYGGILQAAYFSILPGAFDHGRLFAKPITSLNFCHLFPLHNYPVGELKGSQWGEPIAILKTPSNSPYFFNFHISKKEKEAVGIEDIEAEEDSEEEDKKTKSSQKSLGNYRVIGTSGGGKTAFVMAMRVLARKRQVHASQPLRTFSFDYGLGEAIGINALGGQYFTIAAGKPIGINLFSLPYEEETVSLIHSIASWCASFDGRYAISMSEDKALTNSIRFIFEELKPDERRFARIVDGLPNDGEKTLANALSRWCNDGSLAWVLDSAEDRFNFEKSNDFGFDMSKLIDIPEAKTPIARILLHKIQKYAAGTPHLIHMAEGWKLLGDPMMQEYARERGKAIRKENGIIGLDTQDVSDLTSSKFSSSLIQQFPTLVLLPNAQATEEDYVGGLRLTKRELSLVRRTPENQGFYLIKKGTEMSVTRMDLSGMDDMLSVISSSPDNVALMNELRSSLGSSPDKWLNEFYKRRH